MKKVFAKLSLRLLVAMFFMLGGMLVANRAEAQTITNGNAGQQGANWKSGSEASDIAKAQVEAWTINIGGFVVGQPQYNNAYAHIVYYKGIVAELANGESTQSAVSKALPVGRDDMSFLTSTAARTLYTEAKDLLTN